ncbi:MAG: sensor histidine kinase [Stackebrandtia sp.]
MAGYRGWQTRCVFNVIDPLRDRRTYAGLVFALLGAACWLPAGMVAVIALLPDWPRGARAAIFMAVLIAVIAAAGLAARSRSGCVWSANRLLDARLPPVGSESARRLSPRLRTSAWLVTHAVTGGAVVLTTGLLVMTALALPAMWLNGGDTFTFVFTELSVPGDGRGGWTVAAAVVQLLLAIYVLAAAAALWRRLSGRFLGPDASEKLAAVEERARQLARRNRLAQELHDSIGHTLTTSTIQAAAANQLMETDPQSARRALVTIEESSRHALDELDHVLGVLRQDAATREPEHTLADLGSLLDRVEATGRTVRRDLGEAPADIPSTVSREAFRLVQEATTNALRHAPGAVIDVAVSTDDGWLRVAVVNGLAGPAAAGPGRGLVGAAERVRLLGGEITSGPDETGSRWVLTVRLPLPR